MEMPSGSTEGSSGSTEGSSGSTEGSSDSVGFTEGSSEGSSEGLAEGSWEGVSVASFDESGLGCSLGVQASTNATIAASIRKRKDFFIVVSVCWLIFRVSRLQIYHIYFKSVTIGFQKSFRGVSRRNTTKHARRWMRRAFNCGRDTFYSPRVATITALMVCILFSASSKTMLAGLSKTSSVTSMPSRPNFSWTSRPTLVSRL